MTFYADLDVSVLDEMPPGRTPVQTRLVNQKRRQEIVQWIGKVCAQGRQAYWVCPLIEESEKLELQTAVALHAELTAAYADRLKVGLIHGRMKPDAKAQTMDAFVRGEIDVLVASTVIEVGVDVANASIMVIEHAERFGLAQLHQLRGRVGRSHHRIYDDLKRKWDPEAVRDPRQNAANRERLKGEPNSGTWPFSPPPNRR